MRIIHFILGAITACSVSAQNIVNNPGLEIVSSNPTGYNQLNKAVGWSNCNGNYNTQGTWGSPDLLSLNGTGVSQLPCGYITCVQPHSGNNVVGFITYNGYVSNCREYVSTHLTTPMQTGKTYSVSFWATSGSNSKADYVTNNLGVLFTVNPFWYGSSCVTVNRVPHYNMNSVLDTAGWKHYSFLFTADSIYNHITFGNYYNDANTNLVKKTSTGQPYSYNTLDDISVTMMPSVPQSSFSTSSNTVCAGNSLSFSDQSTNSPTAWNWQITGPVSSVSTVSNPIILFPVPGVYTVSLVSSNPTGLGSPAVQQVTVSTCQAIPQSSFSTSSNTVCAGNSLSFSDQSTNSPTAWNWQITGPVSSVSTVSNPIILFPVPGVYTVSLVSSNPTGLGSPAVQQVTVSTCQAIPQSSFSTSSNTVCAGNSLSFSDQSTNSPTAWNWQITGPVSSVSTVSNPTILFPVPGVYTVSLVSSNPTGLGSPAVQQVTVTTCETTGVADLEKLPGQISISPNPSKGSVAIKGDRNQTVVLLNELGQKIITVQLNDANNYIATVASLKPGLYFVVTGRFSHKLVITE